MSTLVVINYIAEDDTVVDYRYEFNLLKGGEGNKLLIELLQKLVQPLSTLLLPIVKQMSPEDLKGDISANNVLSKVDFSSVDEAVSKLSESLSPEDFERFCRNIIVNRCHVSGGGFSDTKITDDIYDIHFSGKTLHLWEVFYNGLLVNFPQLKRYLSATKK